MPRVGRVVLPNHPHHVVQRGHNRQVVFADARDFEYYLADLRELKEALGLRVYAYCLMTNHVHLLLSPGDTPAERKGDGSIYKEKGTDLFKKEEKRGRIYLSAIHNKEG
jgi:REP element-mobilizing transposase RayT